MGLRVNRNTWKRHFNNRPDLIGADWSGPPILFVRGDDLWRVDLTRQNIQRLTEGELLADWFAPNVIGAPWWMGGLPPQVHVSPDGRQLAFI